MCPKPVSGSRKRTGTKIVPVVGISIGWPSKLNYEQEADVGKGGLLRRVIVALTKEGIVTDTIGQGKTKFSGVVRLNAESPFRS
jgi:hypothetical protein